MTQLMLDIHTKMIPCMAVFFCHRTIDGAAFVHLTSIVLLQARHGRKCVILRGDSMSLIVSQVRLLN